MPSEKTMKFRVIAGQYVAADPDADPIKIKNSDGTFTKKQPSKVYKRGDVVESETNLADRHGRNKFLLLSEREARQRRDSTVPTPQPDARAKDKSVVVDDEDGFPTKEHYDSEEERETALETGRPAKAPKGRKTKAEAEDVEEEAPDEDDGLEKMSVADLRSTADDEEVDLSGLHLKADIVRAVRASRKERE